MTITLGDAKSDFSWTTVRTKTAAAPPLGVGWGCPVSNRRHDMGIYTNGEEPPAGCYRTRQTYSRSFKKITKHSNDCRFAYCTVRERKVKAWDDVTISQLVSLLIYFAGCGMSAGFGDNKQLWQLGNWSHSRHLIVKLITKFGDSFPAFILNIWKYLYLRTRHAVVTGTHLSRI